MTQEYRQPSKQDIEQAFENYAEKGGKEGKRKMDVLPGMKKRFVGLVVVPGRLIERVECEG